SIGRMIQSERARQAEKTALRSRVSDDTALTGVALHRRHHNYRTTAALFYFRDAKMGKKIHAAKVYRQASIPGFWISLHRVSERVDGGGIGDEIEPAIFFNSTGNNCLHLLGAAHIAGVDA